MAALRSKYLPLALALAAVCVGAQAGDFQLRMHRPGLVVSAPATPSTPPAQAASATLTANTSANFGSVPVGDATSRTFTFANTGSVPVTGIAAGLSAAPNLVLAANTCGTQSSPGTLAEGQSCSMTVSWTPSAVGALSASLSVTSTAAASPAVLALSGDAPTVGLVSFGTYRGWADGALAQSCAEYRSPGTGRQYAGAVGSGIYRTQVQGQSAIDVYCEMTIDGGGWTLAFAGDVTSSAAELTVSQFSFGKPLKTFTYNSAVRPVLPNGTMHQYNQSLFKGGVSQWVTAVGDWARFNSLRPDVNGRVSTTLSGVLTSTGLTSLYLGPTIFDYTLADPTFSLSFSPTAGRTGMCGGTATPGPKYCPSFALSMLDYQYHYETRSYRELYVR